MGRVETRLYRRKCKRIKLLRRLLLIGLLLCAALIVWHGIPKRFISERIIPPTPTPQTAAYDQTVQTREAILAEERWYAIQTGVFSTKEAAVQKADAYTARGAPGSVVQDGTKWRVLIACYGTEEAASAVRNRLEANQKVDTYLYTWTCPEIRLRLTGMAGQLDTVEAGFTLLTSTASALRDTAIGLDAGEMTIEDALARAEALEHSVALWEDTVHNRFGRSLPELVQDMLRLTADWSKSLQVIQSVEGATSLSAALKKEAMGMFDLIIAWRRELSAT